MRTKTRAFLLAFLFIPIILIGLVRLNYLSKKNPEIQGTQSATTEKTEPQLPENQSVRIFENEIDYDIDMLLRNLGTLGGLRVVEIQDASFVWKYNGEETEVVGKGVIVNNVVSNTQEKFSAYFINNKYTVDGLNTQIDEVGLKYGWLKQNLACIMRVSQIENSENIDLEVRCGQLSQEAYSYLLNGSLLGIRQLFAEKYEKEIKNVHITIYDQTNGHVGGTVRLLEKGQVLPNPGNVGGFLAFQNDAGNWELVYDGNGTVPCENLEHYNFPLDMVPECFDQKTQTLIILEE